VDFFKLFDVENVKAYGLVIIWIRLLRMMLRFGGKLLWGNLENDR